MSPTEAAGSRPLPSGVVTFLLTDVERSTERWEREPDAMATAMALHEAVFDDVIDRFGGVRPLEQGEGDSMVVAFRRSIDALRASFAAQQRLAATDWPTVEPLQVRIGVHTGDAEPSGAGTYSGSAIIRAARIRSFAAGGQVLLSDATRSLAADHLGDLVLREIGPRALKGMDRAEHLWELATGRPGPLDAVAPHGLPGELSTFVGRHAELEELEGLIGPGRLLTITGAGGAGKTRLARRAAELAAARFAGGTWWADLVTVADGGLLASAVGRAMCHPDDHRADAASLAARVGDRATLLVLDNCEHLVADVAGLVAVLRRECPRLAVVATSRAALGVPGEQLWRIPAMRGPDLGETDPVELRRCDAVALFAERAALVDASHVIPDPDLPTVAAICHRLDGVPLSIELAAARTKVLTLGQIRTGLDDAIGLLAGGARTSLPRHQSIEASIAWSHGLLAPPARLLLRRLSIFEGPFSLEAAEHVVADDALAGGRVLGLLEELLDQSLVQGDRGAVGPRFRLLEAVRQFARRELASAGADPGLAQRYTAWFSSRSVELANLFTPAMVELLDRLDDERGDLTASIARLIDAGDAVRLGPVALGLLPALAVRHRREAIVLQQRAVEVLERAPSRELGWLLVAWADFDDMGSGDEPLERAAALAEALDDDTIRARVRAQRLLGALMTDPAAALPLVAEARDACRRVGDLHNADILTWVVGPAAATVGDRELAERVFREAAAMRWECPRCAAARRLLEANFRISCGAPQRAQALVEEARTANIGLADRPTSAAVEAAIAKLEALAGRASAETAARLVATFSEALDHRDFYEVVWPAAVMPMATRAVGRFDPERIRMAASFALPLFAAGALTHLAMGLLADGDRAGASAAVEDLARLAARTTSSEVRATAEVCLAWLALGADDHAAADEHGRHALALAALGPWPLQQVDALEVMAVVAQRFGADVDAARLVGLVDRLRVETGYHLRLPPASTAWDGMLEELARSLGPELEGSIEFGRTWPLPDAAQYLERGHGARSRPGFGWASLTPTERRVAELAAAGRSNPEIAAELLMGRETVKTHLSSVYTKTGLRRRAQLAAEMARRSDAGRPSAPGS